MRRIASAVPGVIEKSVNQHCEIAAAVVAGDTEAAAATCRQHLEHVRDTTIESMTETEQ